MPGYGGTGRALRRIKADHVLDMVLSGQLLGAVEAASWGLVDTVIEDAGKGLVHLRSALKDSLSQPAVPDYQQTDADVEQAVALAEQTVLPRLKSHQTPAPFLICEHFGLPKQIGVLWSKQNVSGFLRCCWVRPAIICGAYLC